MATETAKRKQTLGVLDQLRSSGAPASARANAQYRNEWSGEELPPGEEGAQDDFAAQKAARTEQSQVNTMPEGATKQVYDAMADVGSGPTGMSPLTAPAGSEGMVPYSPEEFERRNSFSPIKTGVTALDQPLAKSKKKKKAAEDETSDVPVQVNAAP